MGTSITFCKSLAQLTRINTRNYNSVSKLSPHTSIRVPQSKWHVDVFVNNSFIPSYFRAMQSLNQVIRSPLKLIVSELMTFKTDGHSRHFILSRNKYFSVFVSAEPTLENSAWHEVSAKTQGKHEDHCKSVRRNGKRQIPPAWSFLIFS